MRIIIDIPGDTDQTHHLTLERGNFSWINGIVGDEDAMRAEPGPWRHIKDSGERTFILRGHIAEVLPHVSAGIQTPPKTPSVRRKPSRRI